MNDEILDLYAQIGALTYGCMKALELLENPNGDEFQANKVIELLKIVLQK
jgi:hypothetical protein